MLNEEFIHIERSSLPCSECLYSLSIFRMQFCTCIKKSGAAFHFISKCIFHTILSTSLIFYYILHYGRIRERVLSRQT